MENCKNYKHISRNIDSKETTLNSVNSDSNSYLGKILTSEPYRKAEKENAYSFMSYFNKKDNYCEKHSQNVMPSFGAQILYVGK